jgi:hypothetical protein
MKPLVISMALALGAAACSSSLPKPGPISPPGASFAGRWDSNWGKMTLRQQGNRVNGRFGGFRNGSISGKAQGNLLLFRWTQDDSRQAGRGYLQLLPGAEALEGRWGYHKDRSQGGRWWAKRASGFSP